MEEIIRVQKITIQNLKNVNSGTIDFNDQYDSGEKISNIVGLYGPNGSGKSTMVTAFRIIQYLLAGNSIKMYNNIIKVDKLFSSIEIMFLMITDKYKLEVTYFIKATRFGISDETIIYKKIDTDEKSKVSISIENNSRENFFTPNIRIKDFGVNPENLYKFQAIKKNSLSEYTSFFFSNDFINELLVYVQDKYFRDIIKIFNNYAKTHIFIVESSRNALVASDPQTNFPYPVGLIFTNIQGAEQYIDNYFSFGKNKAPEKLMQSIREGINAINEVISTVIPNLEIKINLISETKSVFGEKEFTFELNSIRDGMEFPLIWESDGIKKIISFISCLIHMYNHENTLVVVDEIDSGVFEFLIGELIQVLEEGGSGQLLFASHNLRPVELLDPKEIWFSTINPDNRYIQFKYVKPNHNLRNLLFKTIKLGGQKESVYEAADQYKIRNAFLKAAKK